MPPCLRIESLAQAATDCERTLLGLFMLEPERLREADLAVSDFGTPCHREVFSVLNMLEVNGETWDPVTVVDHLRSTGRLEKAGGAAYISDLTTGIPRNMAISSHVTRVRESSIRRRTAKAFEDGLSAAYDPTVSPSVLLKNTLSTMERIGDGFDQDGNLLPYGLNAVKAARAPELVCLLNVRPLPVEWLWEPYLPAGMLAMLSGDPGGGKTYLALAVAAALSKGCTPCTHEQRQPVDTLYLSLENSPEHVVRPRFDLLRGDVERFHLLKGSVTPSGKHLQRGSISLKDVALLENALDQTKAGLLIIDPIQSYLGADVDAHRSNETRPVLDGLARLASDRQCCILLVRHLSKGSGGRAIHRGLGSIDLTGAVRTELMAGSAPDNPDCRALVQVKSNLGRFGDSLGFTIGEDGFSWTGKSNLTSADLVAPDEGAEARSEIAGAMNYLEEVLSGGPKMQKKVVSASGFTERTLQRAAKKMNVKRHRDGERGQVLWSLA